MKTDIWMPLYIKDYLADTQDLTVTEHGIYLILIIQYWNLRGALTGDQDKLMFILRLSDEDKQNLITIINRFFHVKDDGNLSHKRIDSELNKAIQNRINKSNAGKLGGGNPNFVKGNPNPYYKAKQEDKQKINPTPTPSPSSSLLPSPKSISTTKPLEEEFANANTPQAKFIESFSGLYKQESNEPYKSDSKDFILVAGLLKKYGDDVVINKARILFELCRGRSAWFSKNGMADFTIGNLSRNWNSLVEGVGNGRKIGLNEREIADLAEQLGK